METHLPAMSFRNEPCLVVWSEPLHPTPSTHLQVGLSREGSVLDEADFVLGEVQVSQVGEAVHGAEEHRFQLVLVQSQVVDRVVDVLGDGLVRRLVLTADGQPHVAFVPLDEPAVPTGRVGKVGEEHQGGNNN